MKKLLVYFVVVSGLLFGFAEKPTKVDASGVQLLPLAERMDLAYTNAMSLNYSTPYKKYVELYGEYLAGSPKPSGEDERIRLRKIALDYKYGKDFGVELAKVDELYGESDVAIVQKRFYRGYVAISKKQYESAIDSFSKIDENNFYYRKSLYLQASAYRGLKNHAKAVELSEQYISIETDLRRKYLSMYDLATYLETIGDKVEAKKYFSKIKGSQYLAKPQLEYIDRFLRLN